MQYVFYVKTWGSICDYREERVMNVIRDGAWIDSQPQLIFLRFQLFRLPAYFLSSLHTTIRNCWPIQPHLSLVHTIALFQPFMSIPPLVYWKQSDWMATTWLIALVQRPLFLTLHALLHFSLPPPNVTPVALHHWIKTALFYLPYFLYMNSR